MDGKHRPWLIGAAGMLATAALLRWWLAHQRSNRVTQLRRQARKLTRRVATMSERLEDSAERMVDQLEHTLEQGIDTITS